MNQNLKTFKKPIVSIEKSTVKCEKNMFQLSQISRLWIGKLPIPRISNIAGLTILIFALAGTYINALAVIFVLLAYLLFCIYKVYTLSKYIGLNFELISGKMYCVHSDNLEILQQAYDLINNIIKEKNFTGNYVINFDENGEITNLQEVESKATIVESARALPELDSPLRQELQKLIQHYKNHHENKVHILTLLEGIDKGMVTKNAPMLKELYGRFIQSGLIGDCDELGLLLLINEVKGSVF